MWSYEQVCTNEIEIRLDGKKIASIINGNNDNSQEDFDNASFIVDACNRSKGLI